MDTKLDDLLSLLPEASGIRLEQGSASAGSVHVLGASTDSRLAKPGHLFVCLEGEHTDGHNHAVQAVENGAVALLARRNPLLGTTQEGKAAVILCTEACPPLTALMLLAQAMRRHFHGKVVGITGTAGKTTVKEMLAHVLAQKGKTGRNPLNLNTQIGLSTSILNMDMDEDFWVMEAGISHPHDMEELGVILKPDIAVVLNVGSAHTEFLGDKGVAYYKSRLFAYLAPHGVGLYSADYPELVHAVEHLACSTAQNLLSFAVDTPHIPDTGPASAQARNAHFVASYQGMDAKGHGLFSFREAVQPEGEAPFLFTCPLYGAYGAENIAAVAAVAFLLGLSQEETAKGLATVTLPPQRMRQVQKGGWHILDDSYNANPLSCARMVEAAANLAKAHTLPLVCVMAEMKELGAEAQTAHTQLGRDIAKAAPAAVFWLGGYKAEVLEGLKEALYTGRFSYVKEPCRFIDAFCAWQKNAGHDQHGQDGGVILFKGSRTNKVETLVAAFEAYILQKQSLNGTNRG